MEVRLSQYLSRHVDSCPEFYIAPRDSCPVIDADAE
jgi:hypothetical protein